MGLVQSEQPQGQNGRPQGAYCSVLPQKMKQCRERGSALTLWSPAGVLPKVGGGSLVYNLMTLGVLGTLKYQLPTFH